jgi:hypothetical protein
MKPQKPLYRFLLGAAIAMGIVVIGFTWINALSTTWGSTADEITRSLPHDDQVPNPTFTWNHAITIHAPAETIYPWLVQIGDSRGAFYSITFIENAFCATSGDCKYVNADRIHPEWQTPEKGKQGIIMDYMVIQDYQPGQYVLAVPTDKMPFQWTWLWYVQPVDANTSRLIVRHRLAFPPEAPKAVIDAIFATGYVMERGMILGIQARAEGHIPPVLEEPFGAILWLLVFAMGVACAVRFVRVPDGYHALGVGLEAILVLFILTYIQPALLWRVIFTLMVAAGVVVAFKRAQIHPLVNRFMPRAPLTEGKN